MAKVLLTKGIVKKLTMLGAVRTVSLMQVPYLGLEHVYQMKSNEDMILALAGQFKQLSHEPEKFR